MVWVYKVDCRRGLGRTERLAGVGVGGVFCLACAMRDCVLGVGELICRSLNAMDIELSVLENREHSGQVLGSQTLHRKLFFLFMFVFVHCFAHSINLVFCCACGEVPCFPLYLSLSLPLLLIHGHSYLQSRTSPLRFLLILSALSYLIPQCSVTFRFVLT